MKADSLVQANCCQFLSPETDQIFFIPSLFKRRKNVKAYFNLLVKYIESLRVVSIFLYVAKTT